MQVLSPWEVLAYAKKNALKEFPLNMRVCGLKLTICLTPFDILLHHQYCRGANC